ncbi:MAG TPA: ABC transporter substrate-binding protein [Solirubrobacterales bacterium]
MTRAGLVIVVLGGTALVSVGCGGDGDAATAGGPKPLEKVAITLDGRAGAQSAGVLMAEELGYFEDAGIEPWIGSPNAPSRPAAYVTNGIDEIGLTQQPQLLIAQEKGMPLVAVGSAMPAPNLTLMWPKSSDVRRLADLKGRTIGIQGVPFQEAFLESILARAGLSIDEVEVKRVGYELVPALLSGKVDAILGSLNLDRVELYARGVELVVRTPESLGLPEFEALVVIARKDRLAEDPQLMHGFISALVRGTVAAREDPERAARVIFESGEASRSLDLETIETQLDATIPLLTNDGQTNQAREAELRSWMRKEGMFE